MLSEYIELLRSFKHYKISALIDQMNAKITAALKHPHFNPKIACYFTQINIEGVPCTDFELDPDNVSQIKKLLNALYYARITFLDLEQIDLEKDMLTGVGELAFLYRKTINDAYEACYLFTHLDVDVQELLQEELQLLYPALNSLVSLIKRNKEESKKLAKTMLSYPLSYKAGEIAGTAIKQMQPCNGALDYGFLTQFSALLPSYIDKITQCVQQYSSQLIAQEPTLNNSKIEELQQAALTLLNDLEHLKIGSFWTSIKFIKYIHIIRNIITLSMSSLEQMGNLSDSSQDVIRDNLAQLKYCVLPQLFGLVDKIEVNGMLKPGTLSIPLMEKIKPLYQTLIYYAAKPVDFKAKGEELRRIEDSRFVALRLERTYQRIDKANKALFKIKKAEEALHHFYKILDHDDYKHLALHLVPQKIKEQLIEHYKLLKPFMLIIDVDLNKWVIDSLCGTQGISLYIKNTWSRLAGAIPSNHVSHLLAKQTPLIQLLKKKENTQQFHIDLNTQLIESVQQSTDLMLFPYSETSTIITTEQLEKVEFIAFPEEETTQLYSIDEAAALICAEENNPDLQFIIKDNNTTVEHPEQLNADQTLLLYQYYRNKLDRFHKALKAYNVFTALLASQIKEHYPIPPHVLHFNYLQEESKKKIRTLYRQFKNYFLCAVPAEMSALANLFDQCLSSNSTEALAIESPILQKFEKLDHYFQIYFTAIDTTWTQQSQFYLKQARYKFASIEQNVFLTDESRALRAEGEFNIQLKCLKQQGKKWIADPTQLSANQALTLHQWYRNQRNKFEVARNAYEQFIKLLEKQIQKHPTPQGIKVTLNSINNEIKAECRKLYHLIQPYFINGAPEEKKKAALNFDRFLVHSFAKEAMPPLPATLDMFELLNEHFQQYFAEVDLLWCQKSQLYIKLAQEKYISEHQSIVLQQDEYGARAHYLIKHTNYSKFIYEFRQELQQLTRLFNTAMQAELKIQPSGIPFPELQDQHLARTQSKQVLAIKELYNGVYHIEHLIRQLEQLNDTCIKSLYVYYLIQAYSHIYELIKISSNLAEDPRLQIMGHTLIDKAQHIWVAFQRHIEAYQKPAEEVVPGGKAVQYNALWYTVNAFYLIPKHISSISNSTELTRQHLEKLHVSAKKSSLAIEAIINNSHSYFRLFLHSPRMLGLYLEMKSKLKEFINTLHNTATNNLEKLPNHLFTPMLLEADQCEAQLGLIPGVICGPLKNMLDEYYKGLLQPLKLPSKTHLQFICNKTTLSERIDLVQRKVNQAMGDLSQLDNTYVGTITLHQLTERYQKINGTRLSDPNMHQLLQDIATAFTACKTQLMALAKELAFSVNEPISEALLNTELKEYSPLLTTITALAQLSYTHYLGLKNTQIMQLNTVQEQLAYLTELNKNQNDANRQVILEYAEESFKQQIEELASRHVGLHYVDKEYCTRLKNYLLTFKEGIIQRAHWAEDINRSVNKLLKAKIRHFEEEYFVKYYQLDSVRVALAQFKNYFSRSALAIEHNRSLFENEISLAKKTAEINKLLHIAEDVHLSVGDRLTQIQYRVIKDPGFSRIILEQPQINHFSFAYLKYCLFYLLEALHLYTPHKKACLNALNNATTQEPKISELTKRYGLFTQAKNKPACAGEIELPIEDIPSSPIATPR